MSFVNLTLTQFLALFGGIGAGVFLLYLLDRSQQRKVVASLRFWRNAIRPVESRRWKVRQPLSLLLQLLGVLLLLLAVAQLRVGGSANNSRDHVLVLDTSAWMGAQWQGGTLMDEARTQAMEYVRSLPATDRVIVVRAGGAETPVTSFEEKRPVIEEAIESSTPGSGAVDLGQVVQFADRVRRLHGRGTGEIVFVGSGRTAGLEEVTPISNLRFIQVGGAVDNVGLARVGLRHAAGSRNVWEVYVAVRNQGASPRQVDVSVQFASAPAAFEKLDLPGLGEREFTFPLRTRAAGDLEVQVFGEDGFPGDNYVSLEIPARQSLRMVVYTREPNLLRPLVEASAMVEAEFHEPGTEVATEADVVVFDRCAPVETEASNVIWIEPPAANSPVPVAGVIRNAKVRRWGTDHPLGAGLRTKDLGVDQSLRFEPAPGDAVIAEADQGPVVVARRTGEDGSGRTVVLGFHPMQSSTRNELAAPLLFANIVQWMKPGVFREWELNTGSVGTVSVPIEEGVDRSSIAVTDERGDTLPFTIEDDSVRFYSGRPGIVRVMAGNRELVYSLSLPATSDTIWEPADSVLRGVPQAAPAGSAPTDLWPWLALAGIVLLIVEWLLFGRFRRRALTEPSTAVWRRAA